QADADCATNPWGHTCQPLGASSNCGCTTDAECAGSPAGPICLMDPGGWSHCGCSDYTDCSASPLGIQCVAGQVCGCSDDTACPNGTTCTGWGLSGQACK